MKAVFYREDGTIFADGELTKNKLEDFAKYVHTLDTNYEGYVPSYQYNEEGELYFYPDGPWDC